MNFEQKIRQKVISFFVSCADTNMYQTFKDEANRRADVIEKRYNASVAQLEGRYLTLFKEVPYLIQEGYVYNPEKDDFVGKMLDQKKREYTITIKIPKMYPKEPPLIYALPNFKGDYPDHVTSGYKGSVCVDKPNLKSSDAFHAQSYWKDKVNLKSALHLVQLVLNEEIDRTRKRAEPKVKEKTIMDVIRAKADKAKFIEFLNVNGLKVDKGVNWTVIERECIQTTTDFKMKLVKYAEGLR